MSLITYFSTATSPSWLISHHQRVRYSQSVTTFLLAIDRIVNRIDPLHCLLHQQSFIPAFITGPHCANSLRKHTNNCVSTSTIANNIPFPTDTSATSNIPFTMQHTNEHDEQVANDEDFYPQSTDETIESAQQCPQFCITDQRPNRSRRLTFNRQTAQSLNQKLYELQQLDKEMLAVTERLRSLRERKDRLRKLMICLRRIDAIDSRRKLKQLHSRN